MKYYKLIAIILCGFLSGCFREHLEGRDSEVVKEDMEIRFLGGDLCSYLTIENHSSKSVSIVCPIVVDYKINRIDGEKSIYEYPKEISTKLSNEELLNLPPNIEIAIPISLFRDEIDGCENDISTLIDMASRLNTKSISFKIGKPMDSKNSQITDCPIVEIERFIKK